MQQVRMLRVYRPQAEGMTPLGSFSLAVSELSQARFVLWHLFLRDFISQFRQRILGYLWVLITPLVAIASFVFLNATGVLNPGDTELPYPLFVFVGAGIWGFLISSFTAVSSGLIGNSELVVRTSIPKIVLALTGMAAVTYQLLVHLVVLAILFMVFGVVPSPLAVLYPVMLLPIVILGVGIGLVLSVVGVVARDITNVVASVLGLLMYLTPVVHAAEFENPWLRAIVECNPLTYLVATPRDVLVGTGIRHPIGYCISSLFAVGVILMAIHIFYLIKDRVAERL